MISTLQEHINQKRPLVEGWLAHQRDILDGKGFKLPIYSSFDLRDSGVKLGIVDSNLFPAGFNNLDEEARENATIALKEFISQQFPGQKSILVVPEAHTRNLYYLSNLYILQHLLLDAGFDTTIGSLRDDIVGESLTVQDSEGRQLILEKMTRDKNKVVTKSFKDGLILLNNDFSVKNPPLLDHVDQPIIPPLELGWAHRKKSTHTRYMNCLLSSFSKIIDCDPWLLRPLFSTVDETDFSEKETLERVAKVVDQVLGMIQQKYDQYEVKEKPYVFVKDNSGTYGMGIVTVSSGKEILSLNSDQRNKMKFGKQKSPITSVLIQEGITTSHVVDGNSAEPVLYSVGGHIIGGFTRVHPGRDEHESLNSPGVKFDMLLHTRITHPIRHAFRYGHELSLYGVLADIANIAIAYEYGQQDPC